MPKPTNEERAQLRERVVEHYRMKNIERERLEAEEKDNPAPLCPGCEGEYCECDEEWDDA